MLSKRQVRRRIYAYLQYQNTEMQTGSLEMTETEQAGAKKIYEGWFLNRPPFSYHIYGSEYKGVEKGPTYALEARVFDSDQILQRPDPKEAILVEAFTKIQKYGSDFKANVKDIKKNGENHTNKKNLYKEHHELKKLYFQSVMIYLKLWMKNARNKGDTQTKLYKEYEILFHQVETIHLAHQSYATVLTFVHDFEPLRESGDIVMDHAYNICIRGMNKYLKKIFREQDHNKRIELYNRMKKSIVVRLCHDIGEDFRRQWTSKVFEETIKRIAGGFDSRILNLLFKEDESVETEDVENPHFISKEWDSIERMINALTKQKEKGNREGYLVRQTLENQQLTDEELEEVIDIKNDDRLDNLITLKYMKGKPQKGESRTATQLRKIAETLEIIDLNEQLLKKDATIDPEQIKENSMDLITACNDELDRLQKEGKLEASDIIKKTKLKIELKKRRLALVE